MTVLFKRYLANIKFVHGIGSMFRYFEIIVRGEIDRFLLQTTGNFLKRKEEACPNWIHTFVRINSPPPFQLRFAFDRRATDSDFLPQTCSTVNNTDEKGHIIAQWIRMRLPSGGPEFESQAHHLQFNCQILYCVCYCVEIRRIINKNGGRVCILFR